MLHLTEDQKTVLNSLEQFVRFDNKTQYCLLKGFAGTGKTTTINEFIDWYLLNKSYLLDDIVVTAPTNKAVRVLKRMATNSNVEYKTLHSLMGLRPKIDLDGKEIFVKDPQVTPTLFNYGIVIVDEASMINDELFDRLIKEAYSQKIIFAGDHLQVPPISQIQSKPMMKKIQEEFNFIVLNLTKIVRQAKDNPIISTATEIRTGTFQRKPSNNVDKKGHGVIQLESSNVQEIYDLFKEKFNSKHFSKDSDYAKILAWRNKTVDFYNELIRSFIYYKGVNKIVVGEKIYLKRPVINKKGYVDIFVNDDLVVTDVTVEEEEKYNNTLQFYKISAKKLDDIKSNNKKKFELKVLHENSERRYKSLLESVKKLALSTKKEKRGLAWKEYYSIVDLYIDFGYNYAITTHCAQGSTYKNAFVCYNDIMVNPNLLENQRIFYTACTRPSKSLFII